MVKLMFRLNFEKIRNKKPDDLVEGRLDKKQIINFVRPNIYYSSMNSVKKFNAQIIKIVQ